MVTSVQIGAAPTSDGSDKNRPRRSKEERQKRAANRRPKSTINTLVFNPFFVLLFGLLVVSCLISFFLVFSHPEGSWGNTSETKRQRLQRRAEAFARIENKPKKPKPKPKEMKEVPQIEKEDVPDADDAATDDAKENAGDDGAEEEEGEEEPELKFAGFQPALTPAYNDKKPFDTSLETPHLLPKVPPLPIFYDVPDGDKLIDDLIHNNKPTIAGIVAFFNKYIKKLHEQNKVNAQLQKRDVTGENIDEMFLVKSYFDLTMKEIDPLEKAYRGRTIFPVREDESLYVSLAAFREHLLGKSLMSAFDKAKDPSKLFFGAVVQNCFGLDGTVCKTGMVVIGKDKKGRDQTSISPKPPDENGIEEFCTNEKYKKYCDNGQVRVLYIHDTDALGPQTARFYASKLWGGETYFMQMDAHLEFAPEWDQYYIDEARATKNFPKSVLSAYPPGFQEYSGTYKGGTPGARLCGAHFSNSPVEHHILRIEMLGQTPPDAKFPSQIPFIAAGFFFAHASFLLDVPFDPYAPWCFMGEEIALSLRAWTSGWDVYAPRKNMIAHQYRPGRLGLPKFWESVGRDLGRASLNTRLQKHVLRRVKHLLGYPTDSEEIIVRDNDSVALTNFEHYSLGHERRLEDYLRWTKINPTEETTGKIEWCLNSELE